MGEHKDDARIVMVTGSASGIGAATVEALSHPSRHLVLLDRDKRVVEQAKSVRGCAGVDAIVVDLADLSAVQKMIVDFKARYGRMDVLVNNAGIHIKTDGRRHLVEEISLSEWEATLAVNLTAPFLLCQAAFGMMKPHQWGRIVNIASRAGRTYIPDGSAHYSSSKAGVIGLTRLLAGEGGPYGITVNCVAPGRVVTPLSSQGIGVQLAEKFKGQVPVGRVGTTAEIAAAIAYFVSDQAAFTTGVVMDVNGGAFMG